MSGIHVPRHHARLEKALYPPVRVTLTICEEAQPFQIGLTNGGRGSEPTLGSRGDDMFSRSRKSCTLNEVNTGSTPEDG